MKITKKLMILMLIASMVLLFTALSLTGCDNGTTGGGDGPITTDSTASGKFAMIPDDPPNDNNLMVYFIDNGYKVFPELKDLDFDDMWFQSNLSLLGDNKLYCQAIDGGYEWPRKSGGVNAVYPYEGTWEHTESGTGNVWNVTLSGSKIGQYTIYYDGHSYYETGVVGNYTLTKTAPVVNNITNEAVAKEFAKAVRRSMVEMDAYDLSQTIPYGNTETAYGNTGSVAATGQKTYSYTDSNGGLWYTITANTNITLSYSNYSNVSGLTLSGNGAFQRGYSNVYHGFSVEELYIYCTLTSCHYKFSYGGTTYSGIVTLTYNAPKNSSTYTANITFQGGMTFNVSGSL